MIEYKDNFITAIQSEWYELPRNVTYDHIRFRFYKFRIDGVEYKKDSPEFRKAFNIDRTWNQLLKSND